VLPSILIGPSGGAGGPSSRGVGGPSAGGTPKTVK